MGKWMPEVIGWSYTRDTKVPIAGSKAACAGGSTDSESACTGDQGVSCIALTNNQEHFSYETNSTQTYDK